MNRNQHFKTVDSWKSARSCLNFQPRRPTYTAGHKVQSLQIHIRDHKLRELAIADRTLEVHYGVFVLSEARKERSEATRLALSTRYGLSAQENKVAGYPAKTYELGPEPSAMDIDGRSPAVVTWHEAEQFYLIASTVLPVIELLKIANSLYK